jgi:hypothetical protein
MGSAFARFALTALAPATTPVPPAGAEATAEAPAPPGDAPAAASPRLTAATPDEDGREPDRLAGIAFGAYAEVYYQWNFGHPTNGITNYRGFDNRHNSFTISNVALGAQWDRRNVVGRVMLQVGHTPTSYYASEPSATGAGGASATGAELWKYVQQAHVGYRFGVLEGLTVSAGLYLTPIGPESIAVYENWNWSRSNPFFALPYYHTGLRAILAVTDRGALTAAVANGWNSVVDNNDEKSLSLQATHTRDDVVVGLVYFTGVERDRGAAEGRHWRHLLDAHVTWHARPWLSLLAHADGGIEPTPWGPSMWLTGALYARFRVADPLYFALRGDAFREHVADDGEGRASAIFWPTPWIASGTATIEALPHPRISFRFEYRHDHAADPIYFAGRVFGDGSDVPWAPNRAYQDTLTGGVVAWF